MPTGTSNEDFVNLGTNVFKSTRMLPNTKKIRIRWLSYYNNGTAKSVWVANPKIVEIPAYSTAKTVRQNGVCNGVKINSIEGIIVRTNENDEIGTVKTVFNATDGVKIEKYEDKVFGPKWNPKFFVDTNGDLTAKDLIANNITLKDGKIKDANDNVLIDLTNDTINLSNFSIINGNITANNIDATNLNISSANIYGTITADGVKANWLEAQTIKGNQIEGGTISGVNINIDTNCSIGEWLDINPINFNARIRWGKSSSSPEIYIDPGSGAMFIEANAIYANNQRIDQPFVAVFG